MATTMEELGRELRETNQVMADVRENTELSADYLDLVVDTIAERFNDLYDVIQRDRPVVSGDSGQQISNITDSSMTQVQNNTEQANEYLESVVSVLSTKLDELVSFMRGNTLDQLETRREEKDLPSPDVAPVKEDDYIQDFMKKVKDLVDDTLKVFGLVVGAIAAPFVTIGAFFAELRVQTKILDKFLGGGLGKIFSPITRFFSAISKSKAITGLVELWNGKVKPFFQRMGRFLGLLDDAGKAAGGFGKIIRTAAKIGSMLGRIFYPITVLIGVFNAVTGFMEGYKEGGIIEGIKQGVVKAFDAIFGSFIRLLYDIPAFLLRSIGLNDLASSLSNFGSTLVDTIITSFESAVDLLVGLFTLDFEKIKKASIAGSEALLNLGSAIGDLILSIGSTIWGLFTSVTHSIADKIVSLNVGEMLGNAASAAGDFIKTILRSILPDPSKDYGITDPRKYITMAIPDSVYEFAGINPSTGELVESADVGAAVATGNQLQQEGEARRDAEREGNQRGRGGSGGDVNVASSVTNNSSAVVQPRPSAGAEPDNVSDTVMVGWAP